MNHPDRDTRERVARATGQAEEKIDPDTLTEFRDTYRTLSEAIALADFPVPELQRAKRGLEEALGAEGMHYLKALEVREETLEVLQSQHEETKKEAAEQEARELPTRPLTDRLKGVVTENE